MPSLWQTSTKCKTGLQECINVKLDSNGQPGESNSSRSSHFIPVDQKFALYICLILILTYQIAIMALRSWSQLRFFVSRLRTGSGNSSFATSTMPKMKSYAPAAADDVHGHHPSFKVGPAGADFVPVYVSLGLITLSMSFGMYTAVHHIKWSPNVRVKKSRRETIPEVVEPELVAEEVDHFINNSFFRKVAHLQDFDRQQVMPNPISGDVYAWKHRIRAETMKDVGVEPPKDPAPYSKAIRVDRQRL